ncbi:GNAT family N-acetyltransferase [Egicoccus sp. AB-alg2]|uniref:GNAT family N-acetyltransferase n=1 Tax=Egicoccus sp. AB-alg2 TaxID=3242693 RepID=UPI00359EE8B6
MTVRTADPGDHARVRAVLLAAFDDDVPARLVDRLRRDPGAVVAGFEFVAEFDGAVVGHTMLSRVPVDGDRPFTALNLTPLAVAPDRRRRGIGRRLVEHALAVVEQDGRFPLVVLEGDPRHYLRYGFRRASEAGLQRPSPAIPDEAFQYRPLAGHDPAGHRGRVVYPEVFHELGAVGP